LDPQRGALALDLESLRPLVAHLDELPVVPTIALLREALLRR
jgi:hypothetical protein